ncbi:hypothetical protein AB0E69_24775 [Kribbella sp. NPDC026611]|uniref:hypothetical protein n=1 Tax=Kribbella sp. NPDC026611 TaxID=3154911 RepID=UPI003410FB8C
MDEVSARFELVKLELVELQQAIRNYDAILFQVKGWAVTVGLATAGLAFTTHSRSPVLLGVFSSLAFLGIDAHRKSIQRRLVKRSMNLEQALRDAPIADALADRTNLAVPGLAGSAASPGPTRVVGAVLREAVKPGTAMLYFALIVLLCCTLLSLS